MSGHYDAGRSWLSLVTAGLADASKPVTECLRRYEPDSVELAISHAKDVIAAIDRTRVNAVRALVHFELSADEARK